MNPITILVSPAGYDNVNLVLQQLGGVFANTRQLEESEAHLLQEPSFLGQFQHLFLNCHNMFRGEVPSRMITAIQDFVESGHSLYASDWASEVVEAAFKGRTSFKRDMSETGTVRASVKDPYLARSIGRNISIHFDLGSWHLAERFPASADVYLWDEHQRAIAIGFQAGRGRVVFTSFHHHAQQGDTQTISDEEKAFLQWLVTLPTQHMNIHYAQAALAGYRAADTVTQVVSRIGSDSQTIPLKLGSKSGLGVFVLSWDQEDGLEFSMHYHQGDKVLRVEKSTRPPLTMTVRDPKNEDSIEINRTILADLPSRVEMYPYVFAASIRRDLLGDPDWFARAIVRHIKKTLGESVIGDAKDMVTVDDILAAASNILRGLGYVVSHRSGENEEGESWSGVVAKSQEIESDGFDLQMEAQVIDRTSWREEPDNLAAVFEQFLSHRNGVTEATERLLACLVFSREDTGEILDEYEAYEIAAVPEGWRIVSSDGITLGLGQDIVSAEELAQANHMSVVVYRLENHHPQRKTR